MLGVDIEIDYECIAAYETSFIQFSLKIKSHSPFLEITFFVVWQTLNSLGWKRVICHIAPFVTNGI